MRIVLSPHAKRKFLVLKEHGFLIQRDEVIGAVRNPDRLLSGYRGRKVAQKVLDKTHLLRVIFEEHGGVRRIVTFYPARRKRYESEL